MIRRSRTRRRSTSSSTTSAAARATSAASSATSRSARRRSGCARGSSSPTCARSRTSSTSRTTSCTCGGARCTPSTARSSRTGASSSAARGQERSCARSTGRSAALDPDDLLITDGERAVALAAIMGGEDSEVTDGTTELLLEAANFEPLGILRTSERLALRTAGSNRWEKGVDPYLAENAAVLASRLLVDLAGARLTGHADVHDGLPERPIVRFRTERASRLIGLDIPAGEQRGDARRVRLRRVRRLGGDRPHVARARRDARGRPDRGGRASRARPNPAHDASASPRPGQAHQGAAAAACRRGHPRRRGPVGGVHMEPRRVRSEPGRHPPAEPDDLRAGDPPDDDRARARRGRAHRGRRGRRARRAVRDRARLPRVG